MNFYAIIDYWDSIILCMQLLKIALVKFIFYS